MKKQSPFLFFKVFRTYNIIMTPIPITNKLKREIIRMVDEDQKMRRRAERTGVWNKKIDKENTKTLKKIIKKYGWPTVSTVGKKVSHNLWLLVQHSDHDVEFQEKCLELMKKIFKNNQNDILKQDIAFLTDRIRVSRHKPQIFGTQFYLNKQNILVHRPIKNKKDIDKRRKKYDLPPFNVYLKMARSYKKR